MEVRNKYYTVRLEKDNFWFLPGSEDLPGGVFILNREELDRYISTLESLREYLYE